MLQQKPKTMEDLLADAKETPTNPHGRVRNYEKTGGYSRALEEFDALSPSDVRPVTSTYGEAKMGVLKNGVTVLVREGSKTGGATIEFQITKNHIVKIRYD